jgi:hypothetical protein
METADDLKLIRGIGPSLERRLHEAGIRKFHQLAGLSVDELESMVPGVSERRHRLEDWISEAKARASGATQRNSTTSTPAEATFRVEVSLSEERTIRATEVTHLESGAKGIWAGLLGDELIQFIAAAATGEAADMESSRRPKSQEPVSDMAGEPGGSEATRLQGMLALREVETRVAGQLGQSVFLREGQPFTVRTVLDLTRLETGRDVPLSYALGIYANGLVNGNRLVVGEDRGTISMTDEIVSIEVEATGLPKDLYRLTAFATLTPAAAGRSGPSTLAASLEKGPLQVD